MEGQTDEYREKVHRREKREGCERKRQEIAEGLHEERTKARRKGKAGIVDEGILGLIKGDGTLEAKVMRV